MIVHPCLRVGAISLLKIRGWTWSGTKRNKTGEKYDQYTEITVSEIEHWLTICDFSSFPKIARDGEVPRLSILGIVILAICNEYLVIGDPGVA